MAGKSNRSATFFAQKKLLGKAHTSNLKVDGEELIGSNIQSSTGLLFGDSIPESPTRTLYVLQSATGSSVNTVEYVQFALNVLTGTTYDADDTGGGIGSDAGDSPQDSGPHAYKFVLPSDYETSSSNPLKGGTVFKNGKIVHETLGKLQIVPPFYSQTAPNPYIVKIYQDDGSGGVGTEIPLLDNIDWNVDYYNGILFIQDYNASKIPAHARAFAYVGRMADEVISSGSSGGGSSDSAASYLVLSATGSLSNERVLTAGTGLSGTDGGSGNSFTMAIDDSVVATLSGSVFRGQVTINDDLIVSGNIISNEFHTMVVSSSIIYRSGSTKFGDTSDDTHHFTGSATFSHGLSGSLTKLTDGKSYLVAGSNITITSSSNGQVTIAGQPGDITGVTAGTGLSGGGNSGAVTLAINDSVVATVSGTQFRGNIGVTGSLGATAGLSGSLTRLTNGQSYLIAGNNVAITSASNGSVTIASTDTNTQYTAGDGLDLGGTEFSVDLKSSGGLKIDSTELAIDDSLVATLSGSTFRGQVTVNDDLVVSGTIIANEFHTMVVSSSIIYRSGSTKFGDTADDTHHFTGSASFTSGISGSLTRLVDGRSYLVAGDNVTITSASNGQVTIAASASGGSINATSGSTSISSTTRIDFTEGFVVNDSQGGIASVTSSIGTPEDGSYADGLFTDFLSSTPIGTAIDRFNEVLKALAPSPAPVLDNINALHSGTGAFLSFGSSNNLASANPAYTSVAASAGISSAADVNTLYTVVTSSNNLRLGIFDGDTHITGVLNSDVSSNSQGNSIQNYPAFSFGDGDSGVVRLTVNGATVKTVDLTQDPIGSGTSGIGSGSHIDANGSGFKFFSGPATGTFSNGNSFLSFRHRTGKFVIGSGSQRRGWNYARVQHIKTGSTTTTNYIEWVNDDNPDALTAAGNELAFEGSGSIHLSGIEYFRSGSATYKVRVSNAYRNVYDTNNITFTTSTGAAASSSPSFSISAQAKPTINTGAGEDHTKILHLTGTSAISANYFLSGVLTASVNVTHPLKANMSAGGEQTTSGILMYNLSNNSTNLVENFRRENFRIISGSYNTQASLIDAGNVWDSNVHMTASNGGHTNGLQFYRDRLYAPTQTLNGGDFRDNSDGGTLDNAPSDNPDYSGESGQRTFYRWFKNETGSTQRDLTITFVGNGSGTGTIVSAASAIGTNKIRAFVKFPSNGTRETGWLDLATEFVLDSYDDNDGAHTANGDLSFDSDLNSTNYITLGTVGVGNNEYIGLRIEADAGWTGYIDSITISFGAGTGTITAIPDLDDIDCNQDGTDCKLSFGSSKSVTGYTNVGTTAGFSAVDINGVYQTAAASNNLRRSVFQLDTNIEGDLNEDVTAVSNGSHRNHRANSFSDANSGSLKLEVNGAVVHTVEITGSYNLVGSGAPGSGNGTSVNSNGSGFINLSTWEAAEYNNGVPDYTEIYRTGKYRVHTSDQRNGWNYARVIHTVAGSDRQTNYVEWVNDDDSSTMSADNVSITNFSGSNNLFQLSGVKYFTHCTASLLARFNNAYRDVYSSNSTAISVQSRTNVTVQKIVASGTQLSDTQVLSSNGMAMPALDTTAGSETTDLNLTASLVFTPTNSLPADSTSAGAAFRVIHPFKSNVTTATQTKSNFLVFSSSDNSNQNTEEYFSGEKYRLLSGSYTTQGQTSAVTASWDSTKSVNDAGNTNYYSGLIIYDGHLVTPITGGNSGDYRSVGDGGSLQAPDDNVNYSTLTVGRREYFRGFENNTVNDVAQVTITIRGNATIKALAGPNSGSLGANDFIHVECKVPGKTGWLDTARSSAGAGNTNDGDGALSGDLTSAVVKTGAQNICTFNGETCNGTASSAEYIAIRITAHKNWTGYLDRITVAYE